MPIIRRDRGDAHPAAEQDIYTWARNLPPDATVHVKEASGYVGSFPAHEIQDGTPIEEFLMSGFGVGTFELAGHANGLFLPGRQKVHLGSYADRQAARHAQATRDAQATGGTMSDVAQVIDMMKTLGWTPGQQADQGANELTNMLVQHAVQSLRPPDPEIWSRVVYGGQAASSVDISSPVTLTPSLKTTPPTTSVSSSDLLSRRHRP